MAKAGGHGVNWGQRGVFSGMRRWLHLELPGWLTVTAPRSQPVAALQQPGLRRLARALDELPAARHEVLVLRKFDGLSAAEVSSRTGLTLCQQERHIASALLHCLRRLQGRTSAPLDEQASYWFSRHINGELAAEQALLLQAWLSADSAHTRSFYDVQRIWSDCEQVPRPSLPSLEARRVPWGMAWELLICALIVGGLLLGSSGWSLDMLN